MADFDKLNLFFFTHHIETNINPPKCEARRHFLIFMVYSIIIIYQYLNQTIISASYLSGWPALPSDKLKENNYKPFKFIYINQ
ncbi:hypothetical protein C7M52_00427 [Mixta theicola]|nr:hypothetical protein C7M52_00427 [Mixta theicola]